MCIKENLCESLKLTETLRLANKSIVASKISLLSLAVSFFIPYKSAVVKLSRDREKKELPESRDLILE